MIEVAATAGEEVQEEAGDNCFYEPIMKDYSGYIKRTLNYE